MTSGCCFRYYLSGPVVRIYIIVLENFINKLHIVIEELCTCQIYVLFSTSLQQKLNINLHKESNQMNLTALHI